MDIVVKCLSATQGLCLLKQKVNWSRKCQCDQNEHNSQALITTNDFIDTTITPKECNSTLPMMENHASSEMNKIAFTPIQDSNQLVRPLYHWKRRWAQKIHHRKKTSLPFSEWMNSLKIKTLVCAGHGKCSRGMQRCSCSGKSKNCTGVHSSKDNKLCQFRSKLFWAKFTCLRQRAAFLEPNVCIWCGIFGAPFRRRAALVNSKAVFEIDCS